MTQVMKMEHKCCHEDLIQEHSLQIQELVTKSQYKEQNIMEIKDELKDLGAKIDDINNNVNKLILNSESNDNEITTRIETIETKIKLYEEFFHEVKNDKNKSNNMQITLFALIVSVIALLANTIFHFV